MSGEIVREFPPPPRLLVAAFADLQIARTGDDEARRALGDLSALARPWDPPSCPPTLRGQLWIWLDQVVAWLNHDYVWQADRVIPGCWPAHPHLVHDLAVIACLRYTAGHALTPDPLEEWHRYALPAFFDRLTARLGGAPCWAAAIAVSTTARRCAALATEHPPYRDVPQLARVRRAALGVEHLGNAEPPAAHRQTALDRLFPVAGLPPGLPGAMIAAESAAVLAGHLHPAHARGEQLTLVEALAVLHAAESTARYATRFAHTLDPTGSSAYLWRDTAQAWRAAIRTLDPFDDGTRHRSGQASGLILWAARLRQGLRLQVGSLTATQPDQRPGPPEELARAAT